MTDTEIAWAAGLFEGEGCLSTVRSLRAHGRVALRASLDMTDRDVVERFAIVVGVGYISRRERNRAKPSWVWQVQTIEGFQHVVSLLRPWLGERRTARADELLAERRTYEQSKPRVFSRDDRKVRLA